METKNQVWSCECGCETESIHLLGELVVDLQLLTQRVDDICGLVQDERAAAAERRLDQDERTRHGASNAVKERALLNQWAKLLELLADPEFGEP